MLDHRRRGEAGVGAAQLLGDVRVLLADALDVHFVEHRVGPGRRRWGVAAPVEMLVDDAALEPVGRLVRRRPGKITGHFAGVGVEQQAFGGEALAVPGAAGPCTR
jgi:hypothetical protein